jgi:3-phenylpropionate/trans-cinnamate dioxygenase ferredoxin subunit
VSEFQTVAQLEDVPENALVPVELDGFSIVLANSEGEILALHNQCSHEEYPLSDGEIVNGQVECLLHGARFDLRSGAAKALPAVRPVKSYECRVENGAIQIRL